MKTASAFPVSLVVVALAFAALLPSAQPLRSQLVAPPSDPAAVLQALQQANTDLIKRQDATLKEIEELTATAREVRIFSKRG